MKLFHKKGFTLVELLVVIAILAILATAAIVGYSSFITKAQISNDRTLVKQINDALIAEEYVHGKPATMHEARMMLKDEGFGIDIAAPKLATKGYKLGYDINKNRVILLKATNGAAEEEVVEAPEEYKWARQTDVFVSAANMTEAGKFSIYAEGWTEANVAVAGVGFDAGDSKVITKVTYTGGEQPGDVVIRTNGGKLTVNAPNDTVNHYAMLNEVTISDVASTDCYHEYGTVKGQLNIAKGKVVLESKANVGFVNVTATTAEAIAIEVKSGADYGRLTCENEDVLNAVATAANIPTEKTMKTEEGTVAIVDNIAYTNIAEALQAFTANKTFELFTDIKNAVNSNVNYAINIPENGTIDGHGYCLEGNIKFTINNKGAVVKNLVFHMTENQAARSAAQIEKYGEATTGTLSSLYANDLSGKVVIEGCTFDTAEWEAIQITPVAGAEIVIKNNIFKHTNDSFKQNRYVHIQSASTGVDFKATIMNNDFYGSSNGLTSGNCAIEVYYMNSAAMLTISENYLDDYATAVQTNHATCLGIKNSQGGFDWIANLDSFNMKSTPNN